MRTAAFARARPRFFYGWWVAFACAGIIFLTGGPFFFGFGTLFEPLKREFGWSHAAIALAFSLRTEVGGLAAPIVGFTVDRMGSRRLMVAGVVVVAVGFLMLSLINSLWQFYGAILVIAIGMSAAGGTVGYVAIAHWFRRRRGRAIGLMTMGGGASGIMVMVLAALIGSFGWRNALFIMGLVQLAVCLPLAWSVRNRPEDMGLTPDGIAGEDEEDELGAEPEGMSFRETMRSSAFWRLSISVTLNNLGTTAIIVHQIPFFTESLGLSSGVAAASATALTLMTLAGRFSGGYLADLIDKRRVLAGAYTITGLSILLFATTFSGWQAFYVLPLFALGYGAVIPVRAAFQAEYFGLKAYGAIQGTVFTIATIGAVIGPVLAGWIFDETHTYRPAFGLVAVSALLAAPLVLWAPRPATPLATALPPESH